ncbi:MAG: ribosome biogenesis GTP-binding protein YihA/YsxC [Candidatus Binatia bacterium]|nr:ribosome biogenesis GTP-binding protein YihA/YsxC [Candidatus Binatia bacterium]
MTRRRERAPWHFAGAVSAGGTPPVLEFPEVAFAGKSNVGKSSLINNITRTRGLARTSRTPGRTQQINFFLGIEEIVFADLPGYGWARAPRPVREAWRPLVEEYLVGRETLRGVVVIVDSRRGLGDEDRQLLDFLAEHEIPVVPVLSKIDKLKQGERVRQLRTAKEELDGVIPFSAMTGEGERDLWRRLTDLAALG